jgi:hypothetical protein
MARRRVGFLAKNANFKASDIRVYHKFTLDIICDSWGISKKKKNVKLGMRNTSP